MLLLFSTLLITGSQRSEDASLFPISDDQRLSDVEGRRRWGWDNDGKHLRRVEDGMLTRRRRGSNPVFKRLDEGGNNSGRTGYSYGVKHRVANEGDDRRRWSYYHGVKRRSDEGDDRRRWSYYHGVKRRADEDNDRRRWSYY